MEQIHRDDLLTVHASDEESLISVNWSDPCGNILDNKNTRALDEMNQILSQKTPDKILLDFRQCRFFFHPENLEWKENLLYARLDYKDASRIAFVIPENLFVYPAFEATRVALEHNRRNVRYFDNHDQALTWLLK